MFDISDNAVAYTDQYVLHRYRVEYLAIILLTKNFRSDVGCALDRDVIGEVVAAKFNLSRATDWSILATTQQ